MHVAGQGIHAGAVPVYKHLGTLTASIPRTANVALGLTFGRQDFDDDSYVHDGDPGPDYDPMTGLFVHVNAPFGTDPHRVGDAIGQNVHLALIQSA
jgi:hypothetical protein